MKTKIIQSNKITYLKNKNIFQCATDRIYSKNHGCTVIIPHVCNNLNAFGAGFANAVATQFPVVKENYHLLGPKFLKNNLGYTQYVETLSDKTYGHKLIFANMITQNGFLSEKNIRPINYLALCRSMLSINKYIQSNSDKDNPIEIHCPKFGSGLAGGNWKFIEDLIQDIWTNISVFVYLL